MNTKTSPTNIITLLKGYEVCVASEGLNSKSIDITRRSIRYFETYLKEQECSTDIFDISHFHIRSYILYLQQRQCFSTHPLNKPQDRGLSGHTINGYVRAISIFYSWLIREEIISDNPFSKIKIPPPPRKVIPAFTESQISHLIAAIDTSKSCGYRNYVSILTMLDTGLRVSELIGLRLSDISIEDGIIKVLGKGNKERAIPMGKHVSRCLWHYITFHRAEPQMPKHHDLVFLTRNGRPVSRYAMGNIMVKLGKQAGIEGVRCSPHTLRHTAAISFLRNGGDVFSLQRLLGHSSLEMTRHYCQVADIDVKKAHMMASPVDNLDTRVRQTSRKIR